MGLWFSALCQRDSDLLPCNIPHGFFFFLSFFFGFLQSSRGHTNNSGAEIKTALVMKVVGELDTIKRPILK